MRFDWYQTTIHHEPRVVIDTLAKLGHELRPCDSLARTYHYNQGFQVLHNTRGVVATVMAGGNGKNPHAYASSEATDAFVSLVRQEWAETHHVTRADAAEDFNEEGAFDRLRRPMRKIAKRHGLRFPKYEDDITPRAGRTQYAGSPTSDFRARLYDKGLEQLQKLSILMGIENLKTTTILNEHTGEYVKPEDWTRLELQARPRTEEGKLKLAQASPEDVWAFSPWAMELAQETMALDLQRIVMRTRKVSKDDETMLWMCRQYGQLLTRVKADLGDWASVGAQIGYLVELQEEQRRSRGDGGGSAP